MKLLQKVRHHVFGDTV